MVDRNSPDRAAAVGGEVTLVEPRLTQETAAGSPANAGGIEAELVASATNDPYLARDALYLLAGREAHRVLGKEVSKINNLLGKGKEAEALRKVLATKMEQARIRANQVDGIVEKMMGDSQSPERQALGYDMKLGFLKLDLADVDAEITQLQTKIDITEEEQKRLDFLETEREGLTDQINRLSQERKEIKAADGKEIPDQVVALAQNLAPE